VVVGSQDIALAWEALRSYDDSAGRRFDEALRGMPLTEMQRRELHYWHRQAMEALRQYAARAIPGTLGAVALAQADVGEIVARAEAAWARALVGAHGAEADGDAEGDADPPESVATDVVVAGRQSGLSGPAATQDQPDALEIRRRALAARLAAGS
jgi:hypothetical protein